MSLAEMTVCELSQGLETRAFSAREVLAAYLERIGRLDTQLGAYLSVHEEFARAQAAAVDARRMSGGPLGALAGIPVALKDNLCLAGQPTTCGSRILQSYVPPYDATVVTRLRQADAVLLGKTNLDEFAMGSSTENSALGVTRNPWNPQLAPGGSSGGSAVAVAAGLAAAALGSDTGGSIRQPAALCGVVGLKPTYGRVSRYGLVAFASSLDQIGPLARSVDDAAWLLEVVAGHDPRDSTSADVAVPAYRQQLGSRRARWRLGLVREHFAAGLDPEVERAVQEAVAVFRRLGADVREVSLPHSRYAIATYYLIAPCEASSNLARYDGAHFGGRVAATAGPRGDRADHDDSPLDRMYCATRGALLGREVQRRIMLGTYALSAGYYDAYYLQALRVRRLIRNDYDAALGEVDLLLGPTTPQAAFRLGEKVEDPLSMYLEDLYTVSANLAGVPGLSLPCGFTADGRPIGLQLQGRPFQEDLLLQAGAAFQQETDWHRRRPTL